MTVLLLLLLLFNNLRKGTSNSIALYTYKCPINLLFIDFLISRSISPQAQWLATNLIGGFQIIHFKNFDLK
jgi:hypothetical protein